MRTVAVVNQKGGCGKTTLCLNLAGILAARRRRVVVIDADAQQSATRWAAQRQGDAPFQVLHLDADHGVARFRSDFDRLTAHAGAELAFLDCPPNLATAAMVAMLLADLALVPVTPSPLDLWAAEAAVELAREARQQRGGRLPLVSLVPYRVIGGTTIGRELPESLAVFGEPVAPPVGQRVALVEAAIVGKTVAEHAPYSHAHGELVEVADHVLSRLRGAAHG